MGPMVPIRRRCDRSQQRVVGTMGPMANLTYPKIWILHPPHRSQQRVVGTQPKRFRSQQRVVGTMGPMANLTYPNICDVTLLYKILKILSISTLSILKLSILNLINFEPYQFWNYQFWNYQFCTCSSKRDQPQKTSSENNAYKHAIGISYVLLFHLLVIATTDKKMSKTKQIFFSNRNIRVYFKDFFYTSCCHLQQKKLLAHQKINIYLLLKILYRDVQNATSLYIYPDEDGWSRYYITRIELFSSKKK